jgi:hypothetical protein
MKNQLPEVECNRILSSILDAKQVRDAYGVTVPDNTLVLCAAEIEGVNERATLQPVHIAQLGELGPQCLCLADIDVQGQFMFDSNVELQIRYLLQSCTRGFAILFVARNGTSRFLWLQMNGGHTSSDARNGARYFANRLNEKLTEYPNVYFRLCMIAAGHYAEEHGDEGDPDTVHNVRVVLSDASRTLFREMEEECALAVE